MATTIKKQGDDITLSITVGDGVDIDVLAELFVYIVNANTLAILAKFSKAGAGTFIALDRISATVYEAIIPSGTTKSAAAGIYNIEGNVAVTDVDYESSEENAITCDDNINLQISVSKASSSG